MRLSAPRVCALRAAAAAMSSTTLRREGDTVFLEHKYYGRFRFRHAGALCDGSAATAEVFAGERTDGYALKHATAVRAL